MVAPRRGKLSIRPGEQQLPFGQATQLREALGLAASVAEVEPVVEGEEIAPEDEELEEEEEDIEIPEDGSLPPGLWPEDVDLTGDEMPEEKTQLGDEQREMLLGPTDRLNEPLSNAVVLGRIPPPETVWRWLPDLVEAASQPDAPVELVNFLRLINYHLGEEG